MVGDVNHYVDGTLDEVKNGVLATAMNTSTDPLVASVVTVGGGPLNAELRRVTALLDDVRLYNRALSDAEILALSRGESVLGEVERPTLVIQRLPDGKIELTWERGVLQSTTAIGQAWSNVAGASSPWSVTPTGTVFYQLIVPAP